MHRQKTGTGFIQRPFLDDKMFYKAISILGQNGTTYDREKIDSSMAHIDIADNPGHFSLKKIQKKEIIPKEIRSVRKQYLPMLNNTKVRIPLPQ